MVPAQYKGLLLLRHGLFCFKLLLTQRRSALTEKFYEIGYSQSILEGSQSGLYM